MDHLERELDTLKSQLERENDPDRRSALLEKIRQTETAILDQMRAESARLARENANMEAALAAIDQKKK